MTAYVRIQDGTPIWDSRSIVPSKDVVISPYGSPSLATVQVNSTDVFVYVKVEGTTIDIGECTCGNTGAWSVPIVFPGFHNNPVGTTTDTQFGVTFTATPTQNTLTGPGINYAFLSTGRRAWAWSPDGRLFAVVTELGAQSVLNIVALQDIVRADGTTLTKGQMVISEYTDYAAWTNANFAWAGRAVQITTPSELTLVCPYASVFAFSIPRPNTPVQPDWVALVSPCGGFVALMAPMEQIVVVSTEEAVERPFRQDNGSMNLICTGTNPSITTHAHEGGGVTVDTGNGTQVIVDDPECTFLGGGVSVHVDRVKASTLPTANLGVLPVGTAVLGSLRQNAFSWVQVPNQNGNWANQSERHWCLLAQAYWKPGPAYIPPPWDGQAMNPPPFPIGRDDCAQRNIAIEP